MDLEETVNRYGGVIDLIKGESFPFKQEYCEEGSSETKYGTNAKARIQNTLVI